jgi:hypothetical protein
MGYKSDQFSYGQAVVYDHHGTGTQHDHLRGDANTDCACLKPGFMLAFL